MILSLVMNCLSVEQEQAQYQVLYFFLFLHFLCVCVFLCSEALTGRHRKYHYLLRLLFWMEKHLHAVQQGFIFNVPPTVFFISIHGYVYAMQRKNMDSFDVKSYTFSNTVLFHCFLHLIIRKCSLFKVKRHVIGYVNHDI